MVGIIVACHRKMAVSIKDSAEHIIGNNVYFEAIEVFPEDGIDGTIGKFEKLFELWKSLDGILVFVDMFGGTPCNSISKIIKKYPLVDVVTGVNLPMVLSAISLSSKFSLSEIVEKILEENKKAVFNLRNLEIFRG